MKVKDHGQVFTPDFVVNRMVDMIENSGRVLEPSCGDGQFTKALPDERTTSVELDPEVAHESAILMDFMDFPLSEKFETIIGNPPYVKSKLFSDHTRSSIGRLDLVSPKSTNLYMLFMEKSVRQLTEGGELIFIIPFDFTKATNARNMNKFMCDNGAYTHYHSYSNNNPFKGATVDVVIIRYVKGAKQGMVDCDGEMKYFHQEDGQLFFTENRYKSRIKDYVDCIKVGAVPGHMDFKNPRGDVKMVSANTGKTGELVRWFSPKPRKALQAVKEYRISSQPNTWNEDNWFNWIRSYKEIKSPCVYVPGKARGDNPFFICEEADAHDGGVLALYPKDGVSVEELRDTLNSTDWEDLGFKFGGRYQFSQRALLNSII